LTTLAVNTRKICSKAPRIKNSSYYSHPKSQTKAAKNIARENLFYKMHRHISQLYLHSNPIFSSLEEKNPFPFIKRNEAKL